MNDWHLLQWDRKLLGLLVSRGFGVTDFVDGSASLGVIVLFAVITQLGDLWFLFSLGGAVYIAGESFPQFGIERQRGSFVFALVAVYTVLTTVLKQFFGLPRPPGAGDPSSLSGLPSLIEPVLVRASTASGYGFPSGHALGVTLVWGGLALMFDHGTLRRRLIVSGVVVVLVSLSRLVLGVHYLVDVLAGISIGVVVLFVLYRLSDRGMEAGRVLLVAAIIGAIGAFFYPSFETVATFGGSIGGWLVWRAIKTAVPAHPSSTAEILLAVGVVGVAGVLFAGLYVLQFEFVISFIGATLAGGIAVGAPYLADQAA